MGCDGGTIPRRDELVRLKKKPEQKDKDAERSFKWRNCALSQETLEEPVVACGLGRLYNKIRLIEALLDKETKPESINHIKNLKDIKDLTLSKNPAYKGSKHTDRAAEGNAPYICPISGLEMTGKFRFIFLWSCGCVLSERALKEVKQHLCHMCQQPFTDNDVVVLNGTDEDVEKLKEKMAVRVANRKSKKSKSKTETVVKIEPEDSLTKSEPSTSKDTPSTSKDIPSTSKDSSSTPKDIPSTSSATPSTSGIINLKKEEQPERNVKKELDTIPLSLPKFNPNKIARGHFGSSKRAYPTQLAQDPSYKKTKKDYSIANDPESSEVYKSIFTSHQTDKDQKRAHWVTYNPFYN